MKFKKICLSISSFILVSFSAMSIATEDPIITIVNKTQNDIQMSFSLCKQNSQFCTFINNNTISSNSDHDSLNIMIPLQEHSNMVTIFAASEVNKKGKVVAELAAPCQITSGNNAIFLKDHGSSKLLCEFGHTS